MNFKTIYTFENLVTYGPSIFLAGPTPRVDKSLSWRPEALKLLDKYNFDGTVFIPEYRESEFKFKPEMLVRQINWEHQAMSLSSAIVFWVPRQMRSDFEMIALTTNIEIGLALGDFFGKKLLIFGGPLDAPRNKYLEIVASQRGYGWFNSLPVLIQNTVFKLNFINSLSTSWKKYKQE